MCRKFAVFFQSAATAANITEWHRHSSFMDHLLWTTVNSHHKHSLQYDSTISQTPSYVQIKKRLNRSDKFLMEIHLRTTGRSLPYGITPATWHNRAHPALNPASEGWYSIYRPRRDGRLSWPRWLVTYRDGLPAHRRSPIQVLTGPGVE